jgi:hypothetical protein
MTVEELARTITGLPVAERLTLLELISRSVREALASTETTAAHSGDTGPLLEQIGRRAGLPVAENSALRQLLGIAHIEGPAPSDEQIRDWLTDDLIDRHG